MSRKEAIVKNTLILTIGKVSTQLITFFLLPLYTAILSTEEYGIVDLLNTLVSLFLPIVTFQVEHSVFRHLIEVRNNVENESKIISTGVFSVFIQCLIYLGIFFIISPFVNNKYKVFLATNVVTYIFASLFQQIARGLGENKKFSIASFITASSMIVFNVLFLVVVRLGANGMLLANMIAQILSIVYLIYSLKLNRYIKYKLFDISILSNLWKYSIPLIPNALSWWIFNASDRVIISSILGIAQNGILSAAHKFSGVYITFYNIFNMSWTEMISLHINDHDIEKFFNKMFNTVLKFFISIALGIVSLMPFLFPIFVNDKFDQAYYQIPIMMLGSVFNVVVGLITVIYVAKKNTKAIAYTSVVSAIINIFVNLSLIKFIGMYAASISTFIAFFVMSIYRVSDINSKYFKIYVDKKNVMSSLIIFFVVLVPYYIRNLYFCFIALLFVVIHAWIMNRESLDLLFEMVKNKIKKR